MITTNYYQRLATFFDNYKKENEVEKKYIDIEKLYWYFTYDDNNIPTLHLAVSNKENGKVSYYDFETKEKITDEQDYKPFAKYVISSKGTFRYFNILPITLTNTINKDSDSVAIRPQGILDSESPFSKNNVLTNTNWEDMTNSWDNGYHIFQMKHKDELTDIDYYREFPYIKVKSESLQKCLNKTREFLKICVKYDFYDIHSSIKEKCDIAKNKKIEELSLI